MKKASFIKIKELHLGLNFYDEFADKEAALKLFDLLGFKDDIVIQAYRLYSNYEEVFKTFVKQFNSKIIKDVSRNDTACIYIPHLQSNLQLFDLIKSMDVQTEWWYIPNVSNLESVLYNLHNLRKRSAVKYGLSLFDSYFDNDRGLHFYFNDAYYTSKNIESIIKFWKNSIAN